MAVAVSLTISHLYCDRSAGASIRAALKAEVPEVAVATRADSSIVALVSLPGKGQINALALVRSHLRQYCPP